MLIVYYQGKMQRIKEQEGVKADSVFFTKTSPILDSSYLNKCVTKMGKTILGKDKRVTLTLIRKCISSLMLDNFPDSCSETAAAMQHRESTARQHYHSSRVKSIQKARLAASIHVCDLKICCSVNSKDPVLLFVY